VFKRRLANNKVSITSSRKGREIGLDLLVVSPLGSLREFAGFEVKSNDSEV
jgi:hypothetical protein